MYHTAINNYFLGEKAISVFGQKKNIKLHQSKFFILYACYIFFQNNKPITVTRVYKWLSANKRNTKLRTVSAILLGLQKENFLTVRNDHRRGFECKIYMITPAVILLMNDIEKHLRASRVTIPK